MGITRAHRISGDRATFGSHSNITPNGKTLFTLLPVDGALLSHTHQPGLLLKCE